MAVAVTPQIFTGGFRLEDGTALNNALAYPMLATQDGIIAFPGGGQTSARQITAYINRVATVATAADSVKLPSSAPGRFITIVNDTANALQVFGHTVATINNVVAATGISQPGNSVVTYYAPVAGKWFTLGSVIGTVTVTNGINSGGPLTFTAPTAGIVLKQGANGKTGTFVAAAGAATVANTSIAITDSIIISLNTVGGTIASQPYVATITAGVGFTVAGGGGSNTSTYNYAVISNAA